MTLTPIQVVLAGCCLGLSLLQQLPARSEPPARPALHQCGLVVFQQEDRLQLEWEELCVLEAATLHHPDTAVCLALLSWTDSKQPQQTPVRWDMATTHSEVWQQWIIVSVSG